MHIKKDRRCVACRGIKSQDEMLRVARIGNEYVLDLTGKAHGRGAYVCKSRECIDLAIKKRMFNRAFKTNIQQTLYEDLTKYAESH